MKKTAFSLSLLLALTLAGCSSAGFKGKEDKQGNDVLFSYEADGKTVDVTANQIYGEMLQTSKGNEKLFNAWLKGVVENVMTSEYKDSDDIIKVEVEAEMTDWLQDAKDQAAANGVDDDEMIDQLLASEGVDSRKELKEKKIYEKRLDELTKQYYKDQRENFVKEYVENYYPFHVSGVLVKISNSSYTLFNRSISEAEAKKLSLSASQLLAGRDFKTVARDSNLSDHTPTTLENAGDLGIMDASTSFNNEFKLGVYSYAIYSTADLNRRAEIQETLGLTEEAKEDLDAIYSKGIPVIDSAIWSVLEESADLKAIDETGKEIKDEDNKGDYASSNLPRNVIFNNYFNSHAISYLGASSDTPADLVTTVTYNGVEEKVVLNKKNGTPIIVVTDENGVQFISLEMNPFADLAKAQEYYLNTNDKLEDTYVGSINGSKDTVDSQVKNYINKGFNSSISANNKFFNYAMFNHYDDAREAVEFYDATLKTRISKYVADELNYRAELIENAKTDTWEELADTLKFQNQVRIGGDNKHFEGNDDSLVESWVRPTCFAYNAFKNLELDDDFNVSLCTAEVIEYWANNLVGGSIYNDGGND